MREQVLLNQVTATSATKVPFQLRTQDFQGQSLPTLKGRGFVSGDSAKIYEWIDGGWQDSGTVVDDSSTSVTIQSVGLYAIDITLAAAGPVSVQLDSSGTKD
jgi:hypothetical protein